MEASTIPAAGVQARGRRVSLSRLGDEALARLVGKGSEWAFATLYERHRDVLYRYCRSILRHDADAQDALQATFAAAYGALRSARRDAPLRPWLFRIAHNQSITLLRQRRAQDQVPDDLIAPGTDVEARAAEREQLQQLIADLRALPDRQRSALVMRELSGLSHEEIAVALGVSTAAAKQTVFQARRTLADYTEGRAMSCDQVCRTISEGDKRALRSRRVRAHLSQCEACAAFAQAIPARSAALRALTPALPPVAAAGILARAIGSSGSGGGSCGAAGTGLAGKAAATVMAAKLGAGVAVVSATLGAVAVLKIDRPTPHWSSRNAGAKIGTAVPAGSAQRAVDRHLAPGSAAGRSLVGGRAGSAQRLAEGSARRAHGAPVTTSAKPHAAPASGSASASLVGAPTHPSTNRGASRGASQRSGQEGWRDARSAPGRGRRSPAGGGKARGNGTSHGNTRSAAGAGRGRAAAPPGSYRRSAGPGRPAFVLSATPAPAPSSAADQGAGRLRAGPGLGASTRPSSA